MKCSKIDEQSARKKTRIIPRLSLYNKAMNKFKYLREKVSEKDKSEFTPLNEYLKVIFPEIDDWIHDKMIPDIVVEGRKVKYRPDFRSETLKMIVEFDGLQHFQNPTKIRMDDVKTELYQKLGFKVIRIPYFIQLTRDVVKILFDIDVSMDLFDNNTPSFGIKWNNTPAFLCPAGIKRMAKIFKIFPQQYEINKKELQSINDDFISGLSLLEREMNS